MQGRGRDEGVDARALGVLHGFPGAVDIHPSRAREPAHGRVLHQLGDFAHRLEIAVGGDGEAGLDHVDAHLLEQQRDLDLLVEIHRRAGRLLAVAQSRVKDDDAIAGLAGGGGLSGRGGAHGANPLVAEQRGSRLDKSSLNAGCSLAARLRSGAAKSQRPIAPQRFEETTDPRQAAGDRARAKCPIPLAKCRPDDHLARSYRWPPAPRAGVHKLRVQP